MNTKPQSFGELCTRYGMPWLIDSEKLLAFCDQHLSGALSLDDFSGSVQRLRDSAKAAFELKNLTSWRADVLGTKLGLDPTTFPFHTIYCNRDMLPAMDKAFELLHGRSLLGEIKTYDGCFNVRRIRGRMDKWSIHSFGLAIDLNADLNPLGGPCRWTPQFLATMKEAGFTLGAEFARVDAMHFQWADNC